MVKGDRGVAHEGRDGVKMNVGECELCGDAVSQVVQPSSWDRGRRMSDARLLSYL